MHEINTTLGNNAGKDAVNETQAPNAKKKSVFNYLRYLCCCCSSDKPAPGESIKHPRPVQLDATPKSAILLQPDTQISTSQGGHMTDSRASRSPQEGDQKAKRPWEQTPERTPEETPDQKLRKKRERNEWPYREQEQPLVGQSSSDNSQNPNASISQKDKIRRAVANLRQWGQEDLARRLEQDSGLLPEIRQEPKKDPYPDAWKPENDPDLNAWKPEGDHIYTTTENYQKALVGDRQEMEQYVEKGIKDLKRFQTYFKNNEIAFQRGKEAPAIVNKRNEYSDRCEKIQQAIDSLIEQEGDPWKPENNPDPRVWKPEGDHTYTTGVDYVKVLVQGKDEQKQYLERLAKDIERLSKYLRKNKTTSDKRASDTKNRRDEYMRRYEDIQEYIGLKVYGWDEPTSDADWEPYYRRNPENDPAWMPFANRELEGHSYTTEADYVRALVGNRQEKEQYLKDVIEDIDCMDDYIEIKNTKKGFIDRRNRETIEEGRDEYVRRYGEIREEVVG